MDFRNVSFSGQDGETYGETETAKYKLTNPSDSAYFRNATSHKQRAQIGFGAEKATIQFLQQHKTHLYDVGDVCYAVSVDVEIIEKFSDKIAGRNDRFRGVVLQRPCAHGIVLLTDGFNALDDILQKEAYSKIRQYSDFEEGDDPYGEHDFGFVLLANKQKVYWKIDYYKDNECELGTAHTAEAYLVMTIMLAEEY